jgi:hypothetical protein
MVKQRLRRGDEPPSPHALVVRGLAASHNGNSVFDRTHLSTDAELNQDLYGFAGLSAWLVTPDWPLQRILEEKLARAQRVALISVDELRKSGLTIWDTGAAPHVDLVALDGGLDTLVEGIMAISCDSMDNPYYASEESS